jgi:signal transduction histidine kinase
MTWTRASGVALVGAAVLLAGACRQATAAAPAIELSLVPPADEGGTVRLGAIGGRVVGARAGQRIVLYARSGDWYVQPFADQPFTAIQPDSTWRSSTHLGTEYAALLVDAEYRPPAKTPALPGTGAGVVAVAVTPGTPPWWEAGWFQLGVAMAAVLAALGLHRRRVRRLTRELDARSAERLAERTRIAQELYDTLLQGFLSASMQLHLAVDQLPEGSPDRTRLQHILGVMGRATDEGRRVLQGLRCGDEEGERLEAALGRLGRELESEAAARPTSAPVAAVEYQVTVGGAGERLRPIIRDEVYRVAREAVVNAFRHARARGVGVEIEYSARGLRVLVRDDGCGIGEEVLASSRDGDCGLPGMRKRAARIGARLRVRRRDGGGTEVEISVPRSLAFPGPTRGSSRRETGE